MDKYFVIQLAVLPQTWLSTTFAKSRYSGMKKIMVEFGDSIFLTHKYRFGGKNKKVATDLGKD